MKRCIFALFLCAFSAGLNAAPVRYTYDGNDFLFIQPDVPSGVSNLSGYLQFDDILAPNLDQYQFTWAELQAINFQFEFTDGESIANDATGGFVSFLPIGGGISTDSTGMITGWKFIIYDGADGIGLSNITTSNQPGSEGDITYYCTELIENGCNGSFAATGIDGAGQWTMSTVPVPAAAWLFGSAIGLLGWMRRKAAQPLSAIGYKEPAFERVSFHPEFVSLWPFSAIQVAGSHRKSRPLPGRKLPFAAIQRRCLLPSRSGQTIRTIPIAIPTGFEKGFNPHFGTRFYSATQLHRSLEARPITPSRRSLTNLHRLRSGRRL